MSVFPQNLQKTFRCRNARLRQMDKQALSQMVMLIRLISINGQQRKYGNQLKTLTQNVGNRNIIGIFVVGIERQNAAGENVHHIFSRSLENHIPYERSGQAAVIGKRLAKPRQLLRIGELGKEQEIHRLLEPQSAVFQKTLHQISDVDPTVKQFTLAGNVRPVGRFFLGLDIGNFGKARHYAVAVEIAQASVYFVLRIHFGENPVTSARQLRQFPNVGGDFRIFVFHVSISFFVPSFLL